MADTNSIKAAPMELPRLKIANGTIEALKLVALVCMVLDHVNKYLLHDSIPAMFAAGRLAVPLFAFVLGCNLARPGAIEGGAAIRVFKRLLIAGAIAEAPFIALGGLAWGWWPLNIMAMLAVTTTVIQQAATGARSGRWIAGLVFIVAGSSVEFWWVGVAIGVAAWSYCKRPNWTALAALIVSTAALYLINRNAWALAALPIIFLAPQLNISVPRLGRFYYLFYPAHLAAIWLATRFL